MRIRDLFLAGLATGALVGLLTAMVTQISWSGYNPMVWWWSTLLVLIGIPLASAFTVRCLSFKWRCCEPSLKHLIPVAFLTIVIPVLGPVFGGTGAVKEIPIITVMGAVGGLCWSSPFALRAFFKPANHGEER